MNTLNDRIATHPFFQSMTPGHIATLSQCVQEIRFKEGDILFREGEPANQLYLIEAGSVALEAHLLADCTSLVETLGVGDVLGWSWMFPPFTWHFQARALEPTTVLAIDGGHLLSNAERNPTFGYDLMKRMAQLVIHRLQETRQRLADLENRTALEG